MIEAAIGIGSNSTRLLVAELLPGGGIRPLHRGREGTRLFLRMEDGLLSREAIEHAAFAVAAFAETARQMGAGAIRLIATSAARDARNQALLRRAAEEASGIPLEILPGEEEARLSFLGCTGGGFCGLIDIGGGSTELAAGGGGRPLQAFSAQLGASRLAAAFPDLSGGGLSRALASARTTARAAWAHLSGADRPGAWYGAGGTMTCLASVEKRLPVYDREAVDGFPLTLSAVERWARALAAMPPEARAAVPGMQPQRADIIAQGAAALWAVLAEGGLETVTVSNRSNLDGCLLDRAAHL